MYGRQSGVPCFHMAPSNARTLCAIEGSKENHKYAVGTCDVGAQNYLQILEHVEDKIKINTVNTYAHEGQVHALESCPSDESLIISSSSSGGAYKMNLWKLLPRRMKTDASDENDSFGLDVVNLDLASAMHSSSASSAVTSVRWNRKKDNVLAVDASSLQVWSVGQEKSQLLSQMALPSQQGDACWDPHSANTAAVVCGTDLTIVDTHNMKTVLTRSEAHTGAVRAVDYNPNKPMTLLTCGHDRMVRIWDLRSPRRALKTLGGHSHWATCAKYNPNHDQLIVSGGSDFGVNLWRVASCSSSAWVSADASASDDPPDVKVKHIDQHEDSVYAVAWSAVDAWTFCSLSFDGRVIANQVPTTEKYKILL